MHLGFSRRPGRSGAVALIHYARMEGNSLQTWLTGWSVSLNPGNLPLKRADYDTVSQLGPSEEGLVAIANYYCGSFDGGVRISERPTPIRGFGFGIWQAASSSANAATLQESSTILHIYTDWQIPYFHDLGQVFHVIADRRFHTIGVGRTHGVRTLPSTQECRQTWLNACRHRQGPVAQ
jgi:hypothetical protein